MIWLPIDNPVAPVHLLQQDDPHELVGKGHLRKAEGKVRPCHHLSGKPYGTADDKGNAALAGQPKGIDLVRQLLGGEHFSRNLKSDHVHVFSYMLHDTLSLFCADTFLCRLAGLVRRLLIRHLYDPQPAVAAKPLAVLGDGILQILFLYLSHCDHCDLHLFCLLLFTHTK